MERDLFGIILHVALKRKLDKEGVLTDPPALFRKDQQVFFGPYATTCSNRY